MPRAGRKAGRGKKGVKKKESFSGKPPSPRDLPLSSGHRREGVLKNTLVLPQATQHSGHPPGHRAASSEAGQLIIVAPLSSPVTSTPLHPVTDGARSLGVKWRGTPTHAGPSVHVHGAIPSSPIRVAGELESVEEQVPVTAGAWHCHVLHRGGVRDTAPQVVKFCILTFSLRDKTFTCQLPPTARPPSNHIRRPREAVTQTHTSHNKK